MTTPRARVLVVDDSAFARKVLRQVLTADARFDVVGFARDGLDALEKIAELSPDVVTLDLVMPELDGIGVLEALRERPSAPRVVVVTMSEVDGALGEAALARGAFEVVHKPTALATDRLYELAGELREKVFLAAAAPARTLSPVAPVSPPAAELERIASGARSIVVVGASTGGPRAVTCLLQALPATFPVPVAVVLHMPTGYTAAFAARLDRDCALEVREAREGLTLEPGRAVIARAGIHLRVAIERDQTARAVLDPNPIDALHRPSVDVLFTSAAEAFGSGVLGVVLTGMGQDGLEGARSIRAAGGCVIVEAASSCIVHGMPRAIAEAHLAQAEVPLDLIAAEIVHRLEAMRADRTHRGVRQ